MRSNIAYHSSRGCLRSIESGHSSLMHGLNASAWWDLELETTDRNLWAYICVAEEKALGYCEG